MMDWLAWLYGRYLASFSATSVTVGTTIVGAVIGAAISYAMISRAIDVHRDKQKPASSGDVAVGQPSSAKHPPTEQQRQNGGAAGRQEERSVARDKDNDRQTAPTTAPVTVNAPGGVVSVNQQGGITANTVIVGTEATYRLETIATNSPDGDRYRTLVRVRLNTQAAIGELRVGIFGKHVVDAEAMPYDAQGPMQIQFGRGPGVQDGLFVVTIQNAYRGYTIVVWTREPEQLRFQLATG